MFALALRLNYISLFNTSFYIVSCEKYRISCSLGEIFFTFSKKKSKYMSEKKYVNEAEMNNHNNMERDNVGVLNV